MRSSTLNGSAKGALLGVIAFVLVSSSFPLPAIAQTTSSGPLFSMTLLAPTSNPTRRQWASIITSSLDEVNIGASLVFVNFDVLLADFFNCPSGCPPPTYAKGGWDAGFIGFGGGSPLPDFGTQDVIVYRDSGSGDIPPIGSNYYFFNNATYNSLSATYDQTFNQTARVPILQQMLAIIEQQRPDMVLFYPTSVYAWASDLQSWGSSNSIDATTANSDYSHWKVTSGTGTTLNVGETGDIGAINIFPTGAQNSYYSAYLFYPVQACGECLDPRTTSYIDGTVSTVTSSADHLTFTVTEKPHTFTDGVPVKANDYIFGIMAGLISQVGWVSEGTFQSILGLNTQFTYSNGTTDYVVNGTYYHGAAPSGFTPDSTFQAFANTTWTFHMSTPYVFTDPVITGISATPMHLYEQYAFSTWSTGVLSGFTGASGGLSTGTFSYTYNSAVYGGNGSGKSYGPLGDGAYIYYGYDPVGLVGTMQRNPSFWNATGLQAMGWDKIQTIHIVYINSKDAAIAALGNGQVNFLDSNYQFDAADVASMQSSGFTVVKVNDPSNGWQEMGLNLNNPVFGTGTATPLGSSNPARAAWAAMMVREAISYLIPRSYIVSQLLQGLGTPGITQVAPSFTFAYPKGVAADPYDPTMAKSFLAAAGYSTGVAPPSISSLNGTAPTISGITVPSFLLGNSFTLTGAFTVDPVLGLNSGGFAITLQQSTNGGANWTSVALGATTTAGAFSITYQPVVTGAVEYRVFFTGLPETYVSSGGFATPGAVEAQVPPLNTVKPANVTNTQYTSPTTAQIGALSDVVSGLVNSINHGFSQLSNSTASKTDLSNLNTQLSGQITTLTNQVNTLNSNLTTTTDIAYVAIAVAIILGIAAIALSRRKPAAAQ
ncbi:MAG TPA: ABC transporter substrate-binding protein [Nitrososphaerales archaeon]|nr:ABC transporter substrate-binding protein [Nitrososphaerales archaeon]